MLSGSIHLQYDDISRLKNEETYFYIVTKKELAWFLYNIKQHLDKKITREKRGMTCWYRVNSPKSHVYFKCALVATRASTYVKEKPPERNGEITEWINSQH
jgi:hypothetical protein